MSVLIVAKQRPNLAHVNPNGLEILDVAVSRSAAEDSVAELVDRGVTWEQLYFVEAEAIAALIDVQSIEDD